MPLIERRCFLCPTRARVIVTGTYTVLQLAQLAVMGWFLMSQLFVELGCNDLYDRGYYCPTIQTMLRQANLTTRSPIKDQIFRFANYTEQTWDELGDYEQGEKLAHFIYHWSSSTIPDKVCELLIYFSMIFM